jgi:hypothetical protein
MTCTMKVLVPGGREGHRHRSAERQVVFVGGGGRDGDAGGGDVRDVAVDHPDIEQLGGMGPVNGVDRNSGAVDLDDPASHRGGGVDLWQVWPRWRPEWG